MTLSKVKNKLSNVFQLLERTDLSDIGEIGNSIADQVDLDLATIYPHANEDTVTPHIAYLYNTRIGWFQRGKELSDAFKSTPVNAFYFSDASDNTSFNMWCLEKCSRANGLIINNGATYPEISMTYTDHNYNFDKMKKLYRLSDLDYKNELHNRVIGYHTGYRGYFNSDKKYLRQAYASAIYIDKNKILHDANDIIVRINPLRTINKNTAKVIGSSNEYIDMTGAMTILIYNDKLVYIRHDGLNFTYKIYSYPNLSLIKTGTESSLRDIYIKNNITRKGLIGPTGSVENLYSGSNTPLFHNAGFVLNIHKTGSDYHHNLEYDVHVIDLYNIIGPMIFLFNGYIRDKYCGIYYL